MNVFILSIFLIVSPQALGFLAVDGPFLKYGAEKEYWDVCYSEGKKVKCSYVSRNGQQANPKAEMELPSVATELIQTANVSCARVNGGIDCWGPDIFRFPRNRFSNISQIVWARVGELFDLCVLDSGRVTCIEREGNLRPISFSKPVEELTGDGTTLCLRAGSQFKCLNSVLGNEWEFSAPDFTASDRSRPGCFISRSRHLCYNSETAQFTPQLMDGLGQDFRKVFGHFSDRACVLDGRVLKCKSQSAAPFVVYDDVKEVEATSYFDGVILNSKNEVLQFHNGTVTGQPRVELLKVGLTTPHLLPAPSYGGICIRGEEGAACFENSVTPQGEYYIPKNMALSSAVKIKGAFYFHKLCLLTESNEISCPGAYPYVLPPEFGKGTRVAIETRYTYSSALWWSEGSNLARWDLRKGNWDRVQLPSAPQSLSVLADCQTGSSSCSIQAHAFSGKTDYWITGGSQDGKTDFKTYASEFPWISPKMVSLSEKILSRSKDVIFAWDQGGPLYYQIKDRIPVFLGRPLQVARSREKICASFPSQVNCWSIYSDSLKLDRYPVGEFSGNFAFDNKGQLFYVKEGKVMVFGNQTCEYRFDDASLSCKLTDSYRDDQGDTFLSEWKRVIPDVPSSEKRFIEGIDDIFSHIVLGRASLNFRMAHFASFGRIGVASVPWQSILIKLSDRAEAELKINNIEKLTDIPLTLELARASLKIIALSLSANENLMEPNLRVRVKEMSDAFQSAAESFDSIADIREFARSRKAACEHVFSDRDLFFFFRPRNESGRALLSFLAN